MNSVHLRNFIRKTIHEGHYTTWRNLDEDIEEFQGTEVDIVRKIAKKLGINRYAPAGQGSHGFAYYIPNNRILKLTKDRGEASEPFKIKGKKNKHISDIYEVFTLSGAYQDTYVVVSELLGRSEEIDELEDSLVWFFNFALEVNLYRFLTNYSKGYFDKSRMAYFFSRIKNEYNKPNKERLLWYYQQRIALIDELVKNNIKTEDWETHNLGLKKNGNLAMFDLGANHTELQSSIPNIELQEWKFTADEYPDFMDTQYNPAMANRPYPPLANVNSSPLAEDIDQDVEKRHLPYKHPELLQRFINLETEANIRSVAPEINLQRPPLEIIKDFDHFYPSLFDNFAEWIFTLSGDQITESKTPGQTIYYHGRTNNRPYRGEYIFLSDDMGYAASYSDMKIVYAYTLNIPESKLFSLLNPAHKKLLAQAIGPQAMHSIEQSSRGEMDWAALNSVANDDYEMGEDLIESLGFRGVKLSERPGINSVYLFHQSDATPIKEIDLNTSKNKQFLSKWFTDKEKEWNTQNI